MEPSFQPGMVADKAGRAKIHQAPHLTYPLCMWYYVLRIVEQFSEPDAVAARTPSLRPLT